LLFVLQEDTQRENPDFVFSVESPLTSVRKCVRS